MRQNHEFLQQRLPPRMLKSISDAGDARRSPVAWEFPRSPQWPPGISHYLPGNDNHRCVSRIPVTHLPPSERPLGGNRGWPCQYTSRGSSLHCWDTGCAIHLPDRHQRERTNCRRKPKFVVFDQKPQEILLKLNKNLATKSQRHKVYTMLLLMAIFQIEVRIYHWFFEPLCLSGRSHIHYSIILLICSSL